MSYNLNLSIIDVTNLIKPIISRSGDEEKLEGKKMQKQQNDYVVLKSDFIYLFI